MANHTIASPWDGKELITRDNTTKTEFDKAVENSTNAFKAWKQVPVYKRAELIDLIGEAIVARKDELAKRVTAETGKILKESEGDVAKALSYIKDTSAQIKKGALFSQLTIDEQANTGELTLDTPQGIVGVIAPSNYPIALSVQSIALAIGAGDSVIVKPHEQCGFSDIIMKEAHQEAIEKWNDKNPSYNIPEALIQHVYSGDASAGQMISESKDIPLVTFVGSSEVGKIIQNTVEERNGKVIIEAGGNAPFIITASTQEKGIKGFSDNMHTDAVDEAIKGAIIACGQRCSTPRRVFIEEGGKENEMLDKFREDYTKMNDQALYSTDPEKTLMGPLLTENAFNAAQKIRTDLIERGIEVIGGKPILTESGGHFMTPMIAMIHQDPQIDEMKKETFAPILYVQTVNDLDRCLDKANNTENQLTGGVWTKKPEVVIERLSGKLKVNQLIINGNTSGSGKNYGGAPGVGFIGTDPKVSQFYSDGNTTIIASADTVRKQLGSL